MTPSIRTRRAGRPVAAGAAAGSAGRSETALFGGTLLLGAVLLFSVQPMFARMVLPVLGGTSAVWATSMVFFQTALLAGYGYAHWTVRRLGSRRQAALHAALLLPPLLVLPAHLPAGWVPPPGGEPAAWLLGVLTVAVGPPFLVVAATAPLLQRWFVDTGHPRGADPYFLYRASNVGSILGLLGYPLLIEPMLPLAAQARLWQAGYALLAVLVAACAVVLWRSHPATPPATPRLDAEPAGRPSARQRARWLGLAFVPSCLLIGVTNVLTTDLAPIPLLWVLPLTIYLATFVVAFGPAGRAERAWSISRRLLPPLAGVALWVLLAGVSQPLEIYLPLHLAVFAVAALFCHGRLAADRPPAESLTGFYLTLAAGGALGGIAAGLLAPVVFDHLLEYPLGLVLALLAVPAVGRAGARADEVSRAGARPDGGARWGGGPRWGGGLGRGSGARWGGRGGVAAALPAVVLAGLLPAAVAGGLVLMRHAGLAATAVRRVDLLLLLAAVAAAVLLARRRPVVRAVALGAVFLVATSTLARLDGVIFADRSFYGTLAVRHTAGGAYHVLLHGTTIHGAQATDPAGRTRPLTYFTLPGPAGDVIRAARARGHTDRVAVIGLGAGTLACHARPGERFTFYEIDPLVARIAADPSLFSYLRDCPASSAVVLGDARVSLSRAPAARYGLLVLDAFSSDSVPVHLLTRQAVELYRAHLDAGGLITLNITNRYLDLEPVVGRVAASLGASCLSRVDSNEDAASFGPGKSGSHWLALAATPADLGQLRADPRWRPCRAGSGRVWTDDYANVVGALDW